MKRYGWAALLCLLGIVVVTAGCGGGGGGGGGGGSSSFPSTGIRVLHGAIEAAPVDLWSGEASSKLLTTAAFALPVNYASTGSGEQVFTLRETGASQGGSVSFPIAIGKNERQTVLLYGLGSFGSVKHSVLAGFTAELGSGLVALRLINALDGAATLQGSLGQGRGSLMAGYGQASEYAQIQAGAVNLVMASEGGTITSAAFTLEAGKAYSVLVTGERGYLALSKLYQD